MFTLPDIPEWDAMHVLVVHLPIGILLVTPLLVILALLVPKLRHGFALAALATMIAGTIGAYVAVSTGEAAAGLVDQTTEGVSAVLDQHEELGEQVRLVFTILTVMYAAFAILPMLVKKRIPTWVFAVAGVVFLVAYSAGLLMLTNTAHLGGRLVHQYGQHALITGEK